MKNSAGIYVLPLLISFLSGCASNTVALINPALQQQAPKLIIVSQPVGKGYYAVVEKNDGHWQVMSISSKPVTRRSNDQQEILFVNGGLRSIAPSFDPRVNTGESAECTPYIQDDRLYGLCNSYFSTSDIGTSIVRNIASCALTLCLAAGTREILDHEKIQQVVIESNLIDIVKQMNSAKSHRDYLADLTR
jgi:hypothetical protein